MFTTTQFVQHSLVAYYGPKPPALAQLIADCQQVLQAQLGNAFLPYAAEQVHATLCGLERVAGTERDNYNFAHLRGEKRPMDLAGLVTYLQTTDKLPLSIQIGGFAADAQPFTSRGQSPHQRSFGLPGDKAVLMGWPVNQTGDYPPTLDQLRRELQRFNLLHAYHAQPADVDNDFYLRLGLLVADRVDQLDAGTRTQCVLAIRHLLAIRPPTLLALTLADLRITAYTDERLPSESTQTWPIAEK
jgi:hypothetical protein